MLFILLFFSSPINPVKVKTEPVTSDGSSSSESEGGAPAAPLKVRKRAPCSEPPAKKGRKSRPPSDDSDDSEDPEYRPPKKDRDSNKRGATGKSTGKNRINNLVEMGKLYVYFLACRVFIL